MKDHLEKVDGVMIGRAAYHTPYLLADIERDIFNNENSFFTRFTHRLFEANKIRNKKKMIMAT